MEAPPEFQLDLGQTRGYAVARIAAASALRECELQENVLI